jgi:hypothetical protein
VVVWALSPQEPPPEGLYINQLRPGNQGETRRRLDLVVATGLLSLPGPWFLCAHRHLLSRPSPPARFPARPPAREQAKPQCLRSCKWLLLRWFRISAGDNRSLTWKIASQRSDRWKALARPSWRARRPLSPREWTKSMLIRAARRSIAGGARPSGRGLPLAVHAAPPYTAPRPPDPRPLPHSLPPQRRPRLAGGEKGGPRGLPGGGRPLHWHRHIRTQPPVQHLPGGEGAGRGGVGGGGSLVRRRPPWLLPPAWHGRRLRAGAPARTLVLWAGRGRAAGRALSSCRTRPPRARRLDEQHKKPAPSRCPPAVCDPARGVLSGGGRAAARASRRGAWP